MNKKLLIWDFDGVIADTEKLWLYNRMLTINETFHLNWTEETVHEKLLGMSDKTKREVLNGLGLVTDDAFWDKNKKMDYDVMLSKGFEATDGVLDVFKIKDIKESTKQKELLGLGEILTGYSLVKGGVEENDLITWLALKSARSELSTIVVPSYITLLLEAGQFDLLEKYLQQNHVLKTHLFYLP